jgi:hypothetical protein
VTPREIEVDEAKIEAIKSWPIHVTLTQLWSFLGLTEFYQHFVRDFNTIAAPLNDLMKKGVLFHWGVAQDQAFHTLINKLTHAPLLQLCTSVRLLSSNAIQVELVLEACYLKKVNPWLTLVKN